MFSQESVRKSLPLIQRAVVVSQRLSSRLLFNQSQSPSPSSTGFHSNDKGSKFSTFDRFLKSASSGFLIFGSSLGLLYYSSVSRNENSFLSSADYSKETTWGMSDDDRFEESKLERKPMFLFGGTLCCKIQSFFFAPYISVFPLK